MKHELIVKLAGWAVLAAAAVMATLMTVGRAGLPEAVPPASGAQCDAPAAGPRPSGATVQAQIRYDSGAVLRYCSVVAMFLQLGAQEQPGQVRTAQVMDGAGRWIAAADARYLLRHGSAGLPSVQAYSSGGAAVLPVGARWVSYGQLLRACAAGDCGPAGAAVPGA